MQKIISNICFFLSFLVLSTTVSVQAMACDDECRLAKRGLEIERKTIRQIEGELQRAPDDEKPVIIRKLSLNAQESNYSIVKADALQILGRYVDEKTFIFHTLEVEDILAALEYIPTWGRTSSPSNQRDALVILEPFVLSWNLSIADRAVKSLTKIATSTRNPQVIKQAIDLLKKYSFRPLRTTFANDTVEYIERVSTRKKIKLML